MFLPNFAITVIHYIPKLLAIQELIEKLFDLSGLSFGAMCVEAYKVLRGFRQEVNRVPTKFGLN